MWCVPKEIRCFLSPTVCFLETREGERFKLASRLWKMLSLQHSIRRANGKKILLEHEWFMRPTHMYSPFNQGHTHTWAYLHQKFFERKKYFLSVWFGSVITSLFFKEAWMMKSRFHFTKSSLPGFDAKSINSRKEELLRKTQSRKNPNKSQSLKKTNQFGSIQLLLLNIYSDSRGII